jgi:hypothetical protein
MSDTTATLNEYQQRRLLITCRHIDELLSNIESILRVSAQRVTFPKYISDIPPAQRKTIQDYSARIRDRLVEILEKQDIDRGAASIPATRAISSNVTFIDIAVAELRPRHMRGYGTVSHQAGRDLNNIVGELEELVTGLHRIVNNTDADPRKEDRP